VVRDELLKDHPSLAARLFDAFSESKGRYLQDLADPSSSRTAKADALHRRVAIETGADPLPFGVGPNERVLSELLRHCVRQGVLKSEPDLETLFAPGTIDLTG
jgi:4,5-dihydroxyphthalate decarboxylase